MSEHRVNLTWKLGTPEFQYTTYNREHTWRFDGGAEVAASAAPAYRGKPENVDPEEAFVASRLLLVATCSHVPLAIAAKRRFRRGALRRRSGRLHGRKNADGKLAVTRVVLRPSITFGGDPHPTAAELHEMHELSHGECFIANSVKTQVTVVE